MSGAPNGVALGTALFVAILGLGVVVAIVAGRFRIPAAVAFVLVGTIFSSLRPLGTAAPDFGPTLLFVYLPPLIFEAAWNMDPAMLRRVAVPVGVLAGPGVVVSAVFVAAAVSATGALPFGAALTLGAIVSATDPVAVIAIFRRLEVPVALQMIVEGESIVNDGVAIALFGIATAVVAGSPSDAFGASIRAGAGIAGGTAIGVLCAILIGVVIRLADDRATELAGTIVLAYVAYLVADVAHGSGVFATAAAAVTLRLRNEDVLTAQHVGDVSRFWEVVAFIANAAVFLSTGLVLQLPRVLHEPQLVAATVAGVVGARALLAYVLLPLSGVRAAGWRTTTMLAGMRGGLSLALALGLPAGFPGRPQIVDATFGIVFVTLVVQGLALGPVLRRLPLQGPSRIGGPSPSS